MDNKNNLLTEQEIYYLCMSSIIGIGFFKLSHDIVKVVGQDGWIANIIGSLYPIYIILISAYIIRKFPDDNIISIGKKYFGEFWGGILGVMYIMQFITLLPNITLGLTNILRVYAVTFLPQINIIICIIAVAWYCAMLGIKNIARMSKITMIIFVLPIAISIGALRSGNILNLQPVLQSNFKQMIRASFLTTFQYSGMEVLLLIHPYFKDKQSVIKPTLKAVFTLTIVYTWIVFITIYYLGPELVIKSLWPFTLVTESLVIPIINNFRFVFVSLWAIVKIKTISNYYYYVMLGVKNIFNLKLEAVAIALFPIFIVLTLIFKNEIIRRNVGNVVVESTVLFNVIYLSLIFAITWVKQRKTKKIVCNKQIQDKKV